MVGSMSTIWLYHHRRNWAQFLWPAVVEGSGWAAWGGAWCGEKMPSGSLSPPEVLEDPYERKPLFDSESPPIYGETGAEVY